MLFYFLFRNILINEDQKSGRKSILVVDIGEAQLANKFATLSRRSGTPAYMSPERAGGAEGSLESDMW